MIRTFEQEYGVDFEVTNTPVIRLKTLHIAIYYSLEHQWSILQYDVKIAFLKGELGSKNLMK